MDVSHVSSGVLRLAGSSPLKGTETRARRRKESQNEITAAWMDTRGAVPGYEFDGRNSGAGPGPAEPSATGERVGAEHGSRQQRSWAVRQQCFRVGQCSGTAGAGPSRTRGARAIYVRRSLHAARRSERLGRSQPESATHNG